MQQEERYIKGRPIVTIFHNEQNLYTVLRIRVDESNEAGVNKDAVVTGYFPRLYEEETYIFYGKFTEHPKYGPQFQVDHFQKICQRQNKVLFNIYQVNFLKELERKRPKILWTCWVKMLSNAL